MTTPTTAEEPKTFTITLHVKDPDEFGELGYVAGEELRNKFLKWGEYATIELKVRADFTIESAKFLPVSK